MVKMVKPMAQTRNSEKVEIAKWMKSCGVHGDVKCAAIDNVDEKGVAHPDSK